MLTRMSVETGLKGGGTFGETALFSDAGVESTRNNAYNECRIVSDSKPFNC